MRPSWNKLLMDIALKVAERSTCERLHVGAILVKNTRIISMGYNGVPSGNQHCTEHCEKLYISDDNDYQEEYKTYEKFKESTEFFDAHYEFSVNNEIHAEMNAILFAAKNGVSTVGTDLYVSYSPCINCAKSILQAGIKTVYYNKKYDRGTKGSDFLEKNGIKCIQVR